MYGPEPGSSITGAILAVLVVTYVILLFLLPVFVYQIKKWVHPIYMELREANRMLRKISGENRPADPAQEIDDQALEEEIKEELGKSHILLTVIGILVIFVMILGAMRYIHL